MKISKIVCLLAFVCVAQLSFAQNQKAKAMEALEISEEQMVTIEEANKKFATASKEIRKNEALTKKEKNKQLKTLKQERKAEMVKVLGEEKYEEYQNYVTNNRRAQRQERMAMIETLNLTEEQKKEWRAINQKYRKQGQKVKADSNLNVEDKKAKAKEMRKAQQAEIKALLDAEQYEQYVAMQKEKRQRK